MRIKYFIFQVEYNPRRLQYIILAATVHCRTLTFYSASIQASANHTYQLLPQDLYSVLLNKPFIVKYNLFITAFVSLAAGLLSPGSSSRFGVELCQDGIFSGYLPHLFPSFLLVNIFIYLHLICFLHCSSQLFSFLLLATPKVYTTLGKQNSSYQSEQIFARVLL